VYCIIGQEFNAETLAALSEELLERKAEDEEVPYDNGFEYEDEEAVLSGHDDRRRVVISSEGDAGDFVDVDFVDPEAPLPTRMPEKIQDFSNLPAPKTIGEIKADRDAHEHDKIRLSSPMKATQSLFKSVDESVSTVIGSHNTKHVKKLTRHGFEQTRMTLGAAATAVIEGEKLLEELTVGAYNRSSTAFVTFNSRLVQSVAYQMLLSHEGLLIAPAPNHRDIIWENITVPKSVIDMRSFITNIGIIIASFLWSSLVTTVSDLAQILNLPENQHQNLEVVVLLLALLILPFIFDFIARHYECMKLESEIQNSIMTRYFYYQLVNVYVTVGFGGMNIWDQVVAILSNPTNLVNIAGISIPAVSLFFCNLIIVKVFAAVPLEMVRPWQSVTVQVISKCMDKRRSTRRDLRTGAFFAWPMLYGWCYPQLMMVLMIMVTYATIAPFLMPFCILFFAFAYVMYKFQLLYVYINDYQSGGFMWYAVFNRSIVALIFASLTTLAYLGLELNDTYFAGPFYFLLPLPFGLMYFWYYCDSKFRQISLHLPLNLSKGIDQRTVEDKRNYRPTPLDTFSPLLYRQPALSEGLVYPEAYRRNDSDEIIDFEPPNPEVRGRSSTLSTIHDIIVSPFHMQESESKTGPYAKLPPNRAFRSNTITINVNELDEDLTESEETLKQHFETNILRLLQEERSDRLPVITEEEDYEIDDDV
jgi:hypothetical protein